MAGNLIWRGKPGAETFHGKGGDDLIQGYTGNDKLYGNSGNDSIYGEEDNDRLFGEKGDDRLDGGEGKDKLKGGSGSDIFVFADGYGKDTVVDFKATGKIHDLVDLSDLSKISDYDDLVENHMSQKGDDVLIDGGKGAVLTLEDVDIKDLDISDFLFF